LKINEFFFLKTTRDLLFLNNRPGRSRVIIEWNSIITVGMKKKKLEQNVYIIRNMLDMEDNVLPKNVNLLLRSIEEPRLSIKSHCVNFPVSI